MPVRLLFPERLTQPLEPCGRVAVREKYLDEEQLVLLGSCPGHGELKFS